MTLLTTARAQMCYCPGCSHGLVLEHIAAAARRRQLDPLKICLVSDIGCIGTADQYFSCHTFHGLHGRSITYAEGIKRANPELTVMVLIGDGGCGIGTAHLVHAARRNADIKVIVCNNFNFGMTGGQSSPTTPRDARTATTPHGARELPLDVCRTVMVNGACFAARCSALDSEAVGYIEAALGHPGFAVVDVWELCVAYYVSVNKITPKSLQALSAQLDMPFGLLEQRDRDVAPRVEAVRPAAGGRDEVSALPRLSWSQRREIRLAGSAGQHIRSAAGVIGQILVAGGLYATQQDDYPITVRRGHSISDLIIDAQPIWYTGTDHADVIIVMSADGAERLRRSEGGGVATTMILEEGVQLPETGAACLRFSLRRLTAEVGKASAALLVLASALVVQEWIEIDPLLDIAKQCLSGRYAQDNLRTLECVRRHADLLMEVQS